MQEGLNGAAMREQFAPTLAMISDVLACAPVAGKVAGRD